MSHSLHTRWLAAALAGVIALGAVAPAAEAGRGKTKRYKDASCETRVVRNSHRSRVVVREHSHGGQLGAFVGGLILGAVVSNASASSSGRSYDPSPRYRDDYDDYDDSCARPANYYYYDSYCDVRYDSFDACEAHYSHCRHPQVIQVIEVRSGRTLDRCYYDDDGWRDGNGRYGADRRWENGRWDDDRYEDYRR